MNNNIENGVAPAVLRFRQVYIASAPEIAAANINGTMLRVNWYGIERPFPWTLGPIISLLLNPSCDLPKEIDGTSEDEESDFEFKPFGSDGMNGFWK